jgi:tol-pal system protein YbgF
MKIRPIGFSVLLLSLAGCASKQDLTTVRFDIDETKNATLRLQKEMATVQGQIKEQLEVNARKSREELAKSLKENSEMREGVQKDLDTLRKSAADTQANLDSTRVDMRVLAGKVDDVALLARKPADDLALLREDLERRLSALDARLSRLEKSVEEGERKRGEEKAKTENTPEALYQKGLDSQRAGNTQQARELLSRFLETYPKHELAANARYWLGETYYSEKNFEQAILEFQQLIKHHPGKDKVPAAMLKQAMAFKELGDAKSARYVYNKLLDEHPDSAEAKLAKEKLKELK